MRLSRATDNQPGSWGLAIAAPVVASCLALPLPRTCSPCTDHKHALLLLLPLLRHAATPARARSASALHLLGAADQRSNWPLRVLTPGNMLEEVVEHLGATQLVWTKKLG